MISVQKNWQHSYRLASILALVLTLSFVTACKTSQNVQENEATETASNMYNGKVVVIPKVGVAPTTLEQNYTEYKLAYKGLTSKSENKMVFTFDDTTITNKELCKKLNKDENVLNATSFGSTINNTGVSRSTRKQTARPVK